MSKSQPSRGRAFQSNIVLNPRRCGAVVLAVVAILLTLVSIPASAKPTVVRTAHYAYTAHVTQRVTLHRVVTERASAGSPAITRTVTSTVTASRARSAAATRSRSARATSSTAARAYALARARARSSAVAHAVATAKSRAKARALVATRTALASGVTSRKKTVYAIALAAAKAAVAARAASASRATPVPTRTPVPTPAPVHTTTPAPVSTTAPAPSHMADPTVDPNAPCDPGATGTGWTCTFDDEFDGTTLDSSKWTTWNNVNYFNEPAVCYYSGPDNVAVRNGSLQLSVTKLATPRTCPTPYGMRTATYGAGVAYTQGHFSQTYGMFAARIKFPGGTGVHSAFWMSPEANNYPGHAEIDVAEPWGALPNSVYASTHITGLENAYLSKTTACSVNDWAAAFHTYWVKWTSTSLSFGVDGNTCATYTDWTPLAGFPGSAPFNQPFYLILQDLVDDGSYSPAPNSSTPFPATAYVDWVRAWTP